MADVKSNPAPVGGWNARDGLADMDIKDARRLDNYFPTGEGVSLRGGTSRFVTLDSVSTAPETLMVFASGETNKMLACAGGNIYDASLSGTVSDTLADSLSNNRWSYENMGGYIVFVNGADTPKKYDGTTISDTTITGDGLTPEDLGYVCQSHSRLFFIEKNTLSAWYLDLSAIAGTANELDFSTYCKLGGKLVAIGTWTRDGGAGSDDYTVFLSDKGEALIYQGIDPAEDTTWSLVGVFSIGEPIGDRPLLKLGADLIVITNDGFVPLSKVLPVAKAGDQRLAISDKIRNAVSASAKSFGAKFGWQGIFYAAANYALFNIPTTEGSAADQYVMNTITGSWARFKGVKAVCWALFNKQLYFGAPGGFIVKADVAGNKDDSLQAAQAFINIQGDILPAFAYFGARTTQKTFTMARPVMKSTAAIELSVSLDVDFSDLTPQGISTPAVSGTPWGSPWGSPWGGANTIRKDWIGVSGIGYSASLHIRTATQGVAVTLNSIDYAYQAGGIL